MEIFGFELFKRKARNGGEQLVIEPDSLVADSGVVVVDQSNDNASHSGILDGIDRTQVEVPRDEVEQIRKCREISITSEVDEALTEIRNEIFIFDVEGKRAFDIDFLKDDGAPSPALQKKIVNEFANLYDLIQFHDKGMEYFNHWYIDGRIYFQKVINGDRPGEGIKSIQRIDPLNLRRIRVIPKKVGTSLIDASKIGEWYVYARSFDSTIKYGAVNVMDYGQQIGGLRIRPEVVASANSGLSDYNTGKTISYLTKAIVPYNNLKMMEDSMVIFRVVRAPQRRAIYVDVGQMQKNKADGYMKEVMSRFKNRMTYDSKTGMLSDRKNVLSMLEDYWLPRREGSRGTEIQNLEGQDSNGVLEEVEYYRDKLWRALGVPRSRFGEQAQSFVFGKGIEIQRDEYRFKKFLNNLRREFLEFFFDILKTQLILKKIIVEEDWADIRRTMFLSYAEDNAFVEYKETEIINNRINTLQAIDPFVGKYFTAMYVRKKVLRQTDLEIEEENKQMEKEEKQGIYDKEIDDDGNEIRGPRLFPASDIAGGQDQSDDPGGDSGKAREAA